jgi:hypothetical protein
MLKRAFLTGVAVLSVAGAMAPIANAGEPDGTDTPPPPETVTVPAPPPPPVTVTVPAPPPPPQTVYVPAPAPPPQTVASPPPAPRAPARRHAQERGGRSGEGRNESRSGGRNTTHARPVVLVRPRTLFAGTQNDHGTVPAGGIQAGAGGTAAVGREPLIAGVGAGLVALVASAGGLALRRKRLLA